MTAAKTKAVGKRPVHTKKPLSKQLRSLYKDYQTQLAVGMIAVVMLTLFILFLTTPSKTAAQA